MTLFKDALHKPTGWAIGSGRCNSPLGWLA